MLELDEELELLDDELELEDDELPAVPNNSISASCRMLPLLLLRLKR